MKCLDRRLAWFGAVGSVVLATFLLVRDYHSAYISIACGGTMVCGFYLCICDQLTLDDSGDNDKVSSACLVIAWSLLAFALLAFFARPELYIKPTSYFVLSALAVGFAFTAITTASGKRAKAVWWQIIGFACVIGLSHIWTENLMFPASLLGIDPWTHYRTTTQMLDLAGKGGNPSVGLTTIGGSYSLMHLYLRWVMTVARVSYKTASLLCVGSVITVGNIIFTCLIGRRLFSCKVGAVAGLALAVAGWSIYAGEWVIPNSLGATYSLCVAWAIIRMWQDGSAAWLAILVPVILMMAYATHILAAVWVVGTICCLITVTLLLENEASVKQRLLNVAKAAPVVGITLLTLVVWLTQTTTGSAIATGAEQYDYSPSVMSEKVILKDNSLVNEKVILKDNSPTTTITLPPPSTPSPDISWIVPIVTDELNNGSSLELLAVSAGMLIYIGLGIMGILFLLRTNRMGLRGAWAVLCLAILALGSVPVLLGVSVMAQRWWYLAEVVLAVPLGVLLVGATNIGRGRVVTVAVTLLVVVLAFFSTIGIPANTTNRTLSPNLVARFAFTQKEMEGLAAAESLAPKILGADSLYLCYITKDADYLYPCVVESINDAILTGDFASVRSDVIILRDALWNEPFAFGNGSIYSVKYDVLACAEAQGYEKVWDNGETYVLTNAGAKTEVGK